MSAELSPAQLQTLRLITGIAHLANALTLEQASLLEARLDTIVSLTPLFDPLTWGKYGVSLSQSRDVARAFLRFRRELEGIFGES